MNPQQRSFLLAFVCIIAGLSTPPNTCAQPTTASAPVAALSTPPAYDVMTIKLNKSINDSVDIDSDKERFSATHVSLKSLLSGVYDIKQNLIFGLYGPLESARFDIEAKLSNPDPEALKKMTPEQERKMLLPLLTERFNLKTHTEAKTLPIFELVVIPGGPKFKPSADPNEGNVGTSIHGTRTGSTLTAHGISMQSFAKTLGNPAQRTVIDKTGLTGSYDLSLQWSKDDAPDSTAEQAPSIFTALPEQLGLKLQPAKGPVETLVVDHAELPSEN
jgi:uncharacterized protein (TIGR03435 family)